MGFSNPDSATHYSALKKFRENQLEKNELYKKLSFDFRYKVGRDLIDNWDGSNPDGRNNYLIFSRIKGLTFGAFNHIWVLIDENKFDITLSLEFHISDELNKMLNENRFKEVADVCNTIITHYGESTNYVGVRNGFFHGIRARCMYYLKNYERALDDLSVLKKENLLTKYNYYTYYLIYNNYFGNYYNTQRAQYYLNLYNQTKDN